MGKRDMRPFEEQLADLPVALRPIVAETFNARLRYLRSKDETDAYQETFKQKVRALHFRHQLSPNRIGNLMGVTRERILEIIGKR